jgi:hypothetical protein
MISSEFIKTTPLPSNPSPGPRRLVKTPDAVHPLPKGEGCFLKVYSLRISFNS